jgi:hypothetical protein
MDTQSVFQPYQPTISQSPTTSPGERGNTDPQRISTKLSRTLSFMAPYQNARKATKICDFFIRLQKYMAETICYGACWGRTRRSYVALQISAQRAADGATRAKRSQKWLTEKVSGARDSICWSRD